MSMIYNVGYTLLTVGAVYTLWEFYKWLKKNKVNPEDINEEQEKEVEKKFREKKIPIEDVIPVVKSLKEMEVEEKSIGKFRWFKREEKPMEELDVPPIPPKNLKPIKKESIKKSKEYKVEVVDSSHFGK